MTTDLAETCSDLAAWIPAVAELVAEPDIQATHGSRTAPGSVPPWNQAAANAFYDIHAAVREVAGDFRYAITGTVITYGGSDAATLKALEAIPKLAEAVDREFAERAARQFARLLTRVLQLPAIDLENKPRPLNEPCPNCTRRMLWWRDWTGEVACVGCDHRGTLTMGAVSGEPIFMWEDGTSRLPEGHT